MAYRTKPDVTLLGDDSERAEQKLRNYSGSRIKLIGIKGEGMNIKTSFYRGERGLRFKIIYHPIAPPKGNIEFYFSCKKTEIEESKEQLEGILGTSLFSKRKATKIVREAI